MEIESPTNEPPQGKRRGIDPEAPVAVYTTNNPNDAEIVRAALLAEGIVCRVNGTGQAGMPGAIITKITVEVPAADADRARTLIGDAAMTSAHDGSTNQLWLRITAGMILFIFAIPVALSLARESPPSVQLLAIALATVAAIATVYVLAERKTAA